MPPTGNATYVGAGARTDATSFATSTRASVAVRNSETTEAAPTPGVLPPSPSRKPRTKPARRSSPVDREPCHHRSALVTTAGRLWTVKPGNSPVRNARACSVSGVAAVAPAAKPAATPQRSRPGGGWWLRWPAPGLSLCLPGVGRGNSPAQAARHPLSVRPASQRPDPSPEGVGRQPNPGLAAVTCRSATSTSPSTVTSWK